MIHKLVDFHQVMKYAVSNRHRTNFRWNTDTPRLSKNYCYF